MTAGPTLFVSWRSPTTRAILPIARVRFRGTDRRYEFAYIHAAVDAQGQGFRPFLEFPRFDDLYVSDRPFPLLANRLMPPSRPDHKSWLTALGLPADAHPMEILARTGGERQTDQIELFPVPVPAADGCYLTHCLLRGVRHMPAPATEERIARLCPAELLTVRPEPDNPADPAAALVGTADGVDIGYLPKYLTGDAWRLRRDCGTLTVAVGRVNPPPAGPHHRVLLRIVACWPADFRPFAELKFQPIPAVG